MASEPQFPTDNLYKFISITGLALLVFAFAYPFSGNFDKLLNAEDQRVVLISKIARDRETLAELKTSANKSAYTQGRINALETQAELDNVSDEILKSRIGTLADQLNWSGKDTIDAWYIGFLLSIIGFLLWYYKLQVYEDAIVKAKAHLTAEKHIGRTRPSWASLIIIGSVLVSATISYVQALARYEKVAIRIEKATNRFNSAP